MMPRQAKAATSARVNISIDPFEVHENPVEQRLIGVEGVREHADGIGALLSGARLIEVECRSHARDANDRRGGNPVNRLRLHDGYGHLDGGLIPTVLGRAQRNREGFVPNRDTRTFGQRSDTTRDITGSEDMVNRSRGAIFEDHGLDLGQLRYSRMRRSKPHVRDTQDCITRVSPNTKAFEQRAQRHFQHAPKKVDPYSREMGRDNPHTPAFYK